MEIAQLYQLYLQHSGITTDTRKITPGDIFVALRGPNFNGNNFARQALNAGAAYIIVDEKIDFKDERIIETGDALVALQQLAKHHREQFKIPFIAITGSNGKTTTKELVNSVLSSAYITYTTQGNLNNHIGIPLTLLKIKNDAEIAVIEMGANNPKEIEGYCEYVMPTHGLITNFGKAHLEGFGSIGGVMKAKSELFNYIRTSDGTVFINADDEAMIKMSEGIKNIITYGTSVGSVRGKVADSTSFLQVSIYADNKIENIHTNLVGEYNLPNVLAAFTIGKYFNVPTEKIKNALEEYTPSNSRSQMIKQDSNTIILDAYNANPASMKAAIENFAKMEGSKKILMLGGMMELGKESTYEHEKLLKLIDKYHWEKVILVGSHFKAISTNYIKFDNAADAGKWRKEQELRDTQILIKGSRSIQMEKVLE